MYIKMYDVLILSIITKVLKLKNSRRNRIKIEIKINFSVGFLRKSTLDS